LGHAVSMIFWHLITNAIECTLQLQCWRFLYAPHLWRFGQNSSPWDMGYPSLCSIFDKEDPFDVDFPPRFTEAGAILWMISNFVNCCNTSGSHGEDIARWEKGSKNGFAVIWISWVAGVYRHTC
jgi:hypothetical protein